MQQEVLAVHVAGMLTSGEVAKRPQAPWDERGIVRDRCLAKGRSGGFSEPISEAQ